jgi:hypothetical protein
MSFTPTAGDQAALDDFIGRMIDAYKDGDADKPRIVGILAHVATAAAISNESEFKNYIRLPDDALLDD